MSRILFILLLSVLGAQASASEPYGVLTAEGFGTVDSSRFQGAQAKMLSRRAATLDAQRNLVSTIEGVQITSGTTVKQMMLESDTIAARVKGMLKGAFVVKEEVYKDEGSWVGQVEVAVCLTGGLEQCRGRPTLAQLIQPELKKPDPEQVFSPEPAELDAANKKDNEESKNHTGLIVDISSLSFSPMLDVRVQTKEGQEIYGPGHVNPGSDWLHWTNSLESAQAMKDVVGETPMVVSAINLGDNLEIFVSRQDAINIYAGNLEGGDFLKRGKVIFVLN